MNLSAKQLGLACDILGRFDKPKHANPTIGEALGFTISRHALRREFLAAGLGNPRDWCIGGLRSNRSVQEATNAWTSDAYQRDTWPAPAPPPVDVPRTADQMLDEHVEERERRRLISERDSLIERLHEANARARFVEAIATPHTPVIGRREKTSGIREGALTVLASDWHVEEVVTRESVAGRNEYNTSISEARAAKFFDGILWMLGYHRQAFTMRDLILWFGGDLITGFIHDELAETNELTPVEAVLFVKRLLSNGIAKVLTDTALERIVIPCSYGNHGRTTHKRRVKNGAEMSYEWLLYNVLRDEWAHEKRIEFSLDRSAHQYVDAYDFSLHFHHGDEVSYQGGVGGLAVPVGKRVPKWDRVKEADIHHIGHFHQCVDLGRTVVNGSLIGYSEYAMSIGADFEVPKQASYVLDAKRGKTLMSPIWVDEEQTTKHGGAND